MIEMNKLITIICPTHGPFRMTPNDHLGINEEQIAYGCRKCGDKKDVGA